VDLLCNSAISGDLNSTLDPSSKSKLGCCDIAEEVDLGEAGGEKVRAGGEVGGDGDTLLNFVESTEEVRWCVRSSLVRETDVRDQILGAGFSSAADAGGDIGDDTGFAKAVTENRGALFQKLPQLCAAGAAGGRLGDSDDDGESRSALVTSTGGSVIGSLDGAPGVDGTLRCAQRSRTPPTALKKPADPAVSVLDTASRAGASCCSSLRSCKPSCRRRPISVTTEGFSLQGCLYNTHVNLIPPHDKMHLLGFDDIK